jgi:putative transposase
MLSTIALSADERKTLLDHLRKQPDPQVRLRAHIILLLADGHAWTLIAAVLYCSSATIARWNQRFLDGRVRALLGGTLGTPPRLQSQWRERVLAWVTQATPRAFGFFRSRWTSALLALLLWREEHVRVSGETVRRWLHQDDWVWRRPRPVLQRRDPQYAEKLEGLRQLLLTLPDDETVVFEDEVDLQLNPKIGCQWMRKGQQAEVVTPGDNDKCYAAGSLHWRTGKLFLTRGAKRDGGLFVRHLHELRQRLRGYRKIHVICDNAKFHYDCWAVWEFVARYGERVVLHFLPKYAPKLNPIERVWWVLHEQITRNHQCQSLQELVELVLSWLTERKRFKVEIDAYCLPPLEEDHKRAA